MSDRRTISIEELLPRVFRSRFETRHQGALFRALSQGPESLERFLEPFLEDINQRTGQHNDPTYLAYAIETALFDARDPKGPFRKVILDEPEAQRKMSQAFRLINRSIRLSEEKIRTLKELGHSIAHHGSNALRSRSPRLGLIFGQKTSRLKRKRGLTE